MLNLVPPNKGRKRPTREVKIKMYFERNVCEIRACFLRLSAGNYNGFAPIEYELHVARMQGISRFS